MKNFLKRARPEADKPTPTPLPDASKFVPASAKMPDAQRLMLFNPDDEIDDENDQDLAFLQSLTGERVPPTARPASPKQREIPSPAHSDVATPSSDDMDVFLEMAALRQRTEVARQLKVDDVDMGDLLEDLQTTRAALRHRRKAA